MSTDRISVAILEEFIKKVRVAAKSGQKEIRIPINEAENIVHNLGLVSLRLLDKTQDKTFNEDNEPINVIMDGGSFGEKR